MHAILIINDELPRNVFFSSSIKIMEVKKTDSRDSMVTIAKVIGIVCVVMAHAMNPAWITWKVIYTFHMPLFFLLSGYCFKEKYLDDAKSFVLRKLKGIYAPFVVYSLIFLMLHNVFASCHIYDTTWTYGWKDYLWHISRIITRMSHNESLLGIFWFLKELFWGNMLFYCLLRLGKGKKWIPIIILAVLTILLTVTKWCVPYFTISKTTFYASFFISIGYAGRVYLESLNRWWVWGICVLMIAAYVWIGKNISIVSQNIYTILPYTLTSIGGSALVMTISKFLSTNGGGGLVYSIRRKSHTGNNGIAFFNL